MALKIKLVKLFFYMCGMLLCFDLGWHVQKLSRPSFSAFESLEYASRDSIKDKNRIYTADNSHYCIGLVDSDEMGDAGAEIIKEATITFEVKTYKYKKEKDIFDGYFSTLSFIEKVKLGIFKINNNQVEDYLHFRATHFNDLLSEIQRVENYLATCQLTEGENERRI